MLSMATNAEAVYSSKMARGLDHLVEGGSAAVSVHPVLTGSLESSLDTLPAAAKAWASTVKFKGKSGEICVLPSPEGGVSSVLLGLDSPTDLWGYAALASRAPACTYKLQLETLAGKGSPAAEIAYTAILGFALGHYKFDRYKKEKKDGIDLPGKAKLVWPDGSSDTLGTLGQTSKDAAASVAAAFYLARDLITTPAEDMGPQHLAAEAAEVASMHGASISVLSGDELLTAGYPAVHTVGRASHRPPTVIDIQWAPQSASKPEELPLLALVGKGVCFDTGGLNLKTAAGMKGMKKDMGGAALVLALAHVIMSQQLPVRLRVMIPAVENSVSGNSYRPLDVLQTRAGITVENGNTDAEGRLILSDCLYECSTQQPDLLIDAATLTGAARVALGLDVPVVFSNNDEVWDALSKASAKESDPVWRLPLHKPYRKLIDSNVADLASTGPEGGQGGAIIAALFLQEFVKDVPRWIHIDTNASVVSSFAGPGRPEGGEAAALRAVWRMLQDRYAPGVTA